MLDYSPELVMELLKHSTMRNLSFNDTDLLRRIAKGIHEAPKFILPTGGFRNIPKLTDTEIELFNPPYENTVWEYYYPEAMQIEDGLERNNETIDDFHHQFIYRVSFLMRNKSLTHTDHDWLFCTANKDKGGKWSIHPCSVGFNKSGIKTTGIETSPDFMEYVAGNVPDDTSLEYAYAQLHQDIGYELATVVKAIAMLNCENVGHEPVNRPISRLKKTRFKAKYGIEPYQYRVLHIGGESTYDHNGDISPRGEGVRFHLRRGHFRRLASGRAIWVRPCTVGDMTKGRVEKVYKIDEPDEDDDTDDDK